MKFLLTHLFCFIFLISYSQNLTFDQFQSLRTKPLNQIEEFLSSKKWELISAIEPSDDSLGKVVFAYERNINSPNTARNWIKLYLSKKSSFNNQIQIQLNNNKAYQLFLNRLKQLGFIFHNIKVGENGIDKIYKSKMTVCLITLSQIETSNSSQSSVYYFTLYNRVQYDSITSPNTP